MSGVNFLETNTYVAPFRELLSLHKDTNIIALVQNELSEGQQPASPSNNFLWNFFVIKDFPQPNPNYQKQIKKLFRKKIEKWNETIDSTLEEVRFTPRSLQELQKTIKIIFFESKVKILEEKLKENDLFDPKMEKILYRLQILINRALSTPSIEKWKIRPKNAFQYIRKETSEPPELIKTPRRQLNSLLLPKLPSISLNNIKHGKKDIRRCYSDSILWNSTSQCPTSPEIEKIIIEPQDVYDLIQKQKQNLHHQQRACEISLLTHQYSLNWKEKLLEAFAELNEAGAICAVAEKLSTIQAMQIFKRFQDDHQHEWKIIFLFGSIKHATFAEMVQSLDLDVINLLNEILQRSRDEHKQWFREAFNLHRDGFIASCNRMKSKIDALAKRFRYDLEGHHLTENELNHIYELEDHIKLTQNTIVNKLEILLQGVITHPETKHVLFVGIKREYNALLVRLTETRDYEDRPAGCIWPIIYRNIFERSNLHDDEPANEIFGDWGLYYGIDYWKIGLLGKITSDELEKLIAKHNVFDVGIKNLAKLEIKTIADWKKLKIFNSFMFQNFLSKQDNREKLTQWTREFL